MASGKENKTIAPSLSLLCRSCRLPVLKLKRWIQPSGMYTIGRLFHCAFPALGALFLYVYLNWL